MIEQFGDRAVKINGRIIPTLNTQVEDYPRWHTFDVYSTFFPIYFETPFEWGDLWEVWSHYEDEVHTTIYYNWNEEEGTEDYTITIKHNSWDEWFKFYESAEGTHNMGMRLAG